ncbi:MAG: hypothetical protein H6809_05870 [Phycisphaeraceae bacterium]|nr:hypothetical protein [Phycisphaeraceae bacterium]
MLYATLDGKRIRPVRGMRATCPTCGEAVEAKCGQIKVHHWAHRSGSACAQSADMCEWHVNWQMQVIPEATEVVLPPRRADLRGNDGVVIELQHSAISTEEIASREAHYGHMVWMFDATERFSIWFSGPRAFINLGNNKSLFACRKPVFLDFGEAVIEVERLFTQKTIDGVHGYGLRRDRAGWTDRFLSRVLASEFRPEIPTRALGSRGDCPSGKDPFQIWNGATKWHMDQHSPTPESYERIYLHRLEYSWVRGRIETPSWRQVLATCPELCLGWTEDSLREAMSVLGGMPVIFKGALRVVPDVNQPGTLDSGRTREVLDRLTPHVQAGRIAVLPESLVARFRQRPDPKARPRPIGTSHGAPAPHQGTLFSSP